MKIKRTEAIPKDKEAIKETDPKPESKDENKYGEVVSYIEAAITKLADIDDDASRTAIGDLGLVAFNLQSK